MEPPSLSIGIDPLYAVILKETFAEIVADLTAGQLAAVNAYARSDGVGERSGAGLPSVVNSQFANARARARPLLDAIMTAKTARPLRLV
jgi:hypothetical protein